MNAMKMPRFTAEASLYKTSGHYQAGKYVLNSPTHMISGVYPALSVGLNARCPPGDTCCRTCACCDIIGFPACCEHCNNSCGPPLGAIGGVAALI
jgi:hypothetical protein